MNLTRIKTSLFLILFSLYLVSRAVTDSASVTASQKDVKANFPISVNPTGVVSTSVAPLTPVGTRIGFILNNATIVSFSVSNQLSQE